MKLGKEECYKKDKDSVVCKLDFTGNNINTIISEISSYCIIPSYQEDKTLHITLNHISSEKNNGKAKVLLKTVDTNISINDIREWISDIISKYKIFINYKNNEIITENSIKTLFEFDENPENLDGISVSPNIIIEMIKSDNIDLKDLSTVLCQIINVFNNIFENSSVIIDKTFDLKDFNI